MIRHASLSHVVLGTCLIAAGAGPAGSAELNTDSGSSPAAETASAAQGYVESALRYEAAGQTEFRDAMLREALRAEPDDPAANWHAGRVAVDGRWTKLSDAVTAYRADPLLAEYQQLRERAAGDSARQLHLARWCARQGWAERARLHYAAIVRDENADPKIRQSAVTALKLKNVGGVLLSPEELAAQREAAEKIARANRHWQPKLQQWRAAIEMDTEYQHARVAEELAAIDDSDVVWAAATMLTDSGEPFGVLLVDLLGRFPEQQATTVLTRFAVLSPWQSVRETATGHLKERSLYGFVPDLLDGLMATTQSRWGIQIQPNGSVRYQHVLYREGAEEIAVLGRDHLATGQIRRFSEFRNAAREAFQPGRRRDGEPGPGVPFEGVNPLEQLAEVADALEEAQTRQQQVISANQRAAINNERIFEVLEATTGVAVSRDPVAWWSWWEKTNETVRPKLTQFAYSPSRSRLSGMTYVPDPVRPRFRSCSCFAAGTIVWTDTGRKRIEQVRVGDRVLSQDPESGELALKYVVQTTVGRPTAAQMRIRVEGETILPTLGHVFWVSGKGWRIAKDLEVGDYLHGYRGGLLVEEMEEQPAPPVVYNLIVEDFSTYFVGARGMLVHDFTDQRPCRAVVPGLLAEQFQPPEPQDTPSPNWLHQAGWKTKPAL